MPDRGLTVVVDAGNGVAGPHAPNVLETLGCTVHKLYCEPDGRFPNHHPDPTVAENLVDLIAKVKRDRRRPRHRLRRRLGSHRRRRREGRHHLGRPAARALRARRCCATGPTSIIFEVKCSKGLIEDIEAHGGDAGHVAHGPLAHQAEDEGDGRAAGRRDVGPHVLQAPLLRLRRRALRGGPARGDRGERGRAALRDHGDDPAVPVHAGDPRAVPRGAQVRGREGDRRSSSGRTHPVIDVDGARIDFGDGWGLVRASNTTPLLVLRFEADTEARLAEIRAASSRARSTR